MVALIDLTGRTYGRLTVLRRADMNASNGEPLWVCQCACGADPIDARGACLRGGITRSCGCLRGRHRTRFAPGDDAVGEFLGCEG